MTKLVVIALPLFVVPACLSEGPLDSPGSSGAALSEGLDDDGTRLHVGGTASEVTCNEDGSGNVTVTWTVTSRAAADSAVVTASVDGGEALEIGVIASGEAGWTFDGRDKSASGEATFTLAEGDHSIEVCVTQSGADGRLPKTTCGDGVAVEVDCDGEDDDGDDNASCNQGVGNGSEGCDPGDSNHNQPSNDEGGGTPGNPGRGGGRD